MEEYNKENKDDNKENMRKKDIPMRRDDRFSKFFDEDLMEPFWRMPLLKRWFPRVDVSESTDLVKVIADIPGVNPDKINIDVIENMMEISGKMERETEFNEKPYRYERISGEFHRRFSLPCKVKEGEIRAVYKDGVLTITAPKAEQERKQRIIVEKQ